MPHPVVVAVAVVVVVVVVLVVDVPGDQWSSLWWWCIPAQYSDICVYIHQHVRMYVSSLCCVEVVGGSGGRVEVVVVGEYT